MTVFENPSLMWFGTERKMTWIEVPQTGADSSPINMSERQTLLNGGGWVRGSWASHKQYTYSWGDSATRETADAIHAYASGTYGRGLIYFIDPMWADKNVLPKQWADPSMAANYEAPPLVADTVPSITPTPNNPNGLPVDTAVYTVPANYDPQVAGTELAIPIPPGSTLSIGFIGSSTGAGVRVRHGATVSTLTPLAVNSTTVTNYNITGDQWAYIGIAGSGSDSTISIAGLTARIDAAPDGPWSPGEGHSGCRFEGKPTLINYGGLNGGQVGVAATLVEVGSWA